jgi:hypothetical protein
VVDRRVGVVVIAAVTAAQEAVVVSRLPAAARFWMRDWEASSRRPE